MLKVNIVFNFKEEPWGGGNQFLKALRNEFKKQGFYAEKASDADVVLFNSHHYLTRVFSNRVLFPKKIFVHRLDGIMSLTRNNPQLDNKIFVFNRLVGNGTIFQSHWAKEAAKKAGYISRCDEAVIMNAPDPSIFNNKGKDGLHQPIRLIATSWSMNPNKGFQYLAMLDKAADFNKYQITFIGNTPIKFNNIRCLPPKMTYELASVLKDHDIYLFPGKEDACSNSLIEALHCGLPAVYLLSGGNSEIVKEGGESFSSETDFLSAIDKVSANYIAYQNSIFLPDISEVAVDYLNFFEELEKSRVSRKGVSFRKRIDLTGAKTTLPVWISIDPEEERKLAGLNIALGYEIKQGPWGGGNQFLKSFKEYFESRGVNIVHNLKGRQDFIFLINPRKESGTFDHRDIRNYRASNPKAKVIHRINETDKAKNSNRIDRLRVEASKFCDAVVFISDWIRDYYFDKGLDRAIPNIVIRNGADERIFNPLGYSGWQNGEPMKVVTHHWSDNWMKGADIYQYFDELLNDKWLRGLFEFTIIGRWPSELHFRNVKQIPPLVGHELAQELKRHHVYLTAARWEACGMHQLEGGCCGLPILYSEEGGGVVECSEGYGIKFSKKTFVSSLFKMLDQYHVYQEKMKSFPFVASSMNSKYEELILNLMSKRSIG
jgi:glycosyltransferase involved in cell wall biosynthesis